MRTFQPIEELLRSLQRESSVHGESHCLWLLEAELAKLAAERLTMSPKDETEAQDEFRSVVLPYTAQSEFCRYVYEKPRGYAGDFVTQEMIWRGRTDGGPRRYAGTSELGRLLNSLTLEMANCRANEERIYRLRSVIGRSGSRLLSVGCGPCIELWDRASRLSQNAQVFLVDQDQGALNFSRAQLAAVRDEQITLTKENVIRFALRPDPTIARSMDLVYAFGLLDYFPMVSARRITQGLWQYVAPGGALLITNATPTNPTRLWMEWGGDWYLDYKSRADFHELGAGLQGLLEASYSIDTHGVYQYLELRAEA